MKYYAIGEKQRHYGKVWRMAAVIGVALLLVATFTVRVIYDRSLQPVSASQHSVLITVESGASVREIGQNLEKAGLVRTSWAFEWYIRNSNVRDKLQAGTYYFRPNQGVKEIVEAMTQGKIATNLFTILPGQRLDQVRAALVNNGGFSASDVDEALKPENFADHPALTDKPSAANLEGYLYPESFQKTGNTKPATVLKQSLDEMQKHLTPDIREAFVKQGLTVHQGVTLASIVEQEVSNKDDRKIVAQVFLTRLKQGMPLQSDVTVIYGALKAGQPPKLDYDSDYNTFLHPGLPPGPISNVSESSLQAVAFPSDTDYIFFVAGDDGKTYFAHTQAEHEKNVELYCKKLCQQ